MSTSSKEYTLASMMEEVKTAQNPTATVDVTPFLIVPEGETRLLEWECPDLSALYRIGGDASELKKRFPHWEEQLAIDVATIAACHVGPRTGGTPPGLFYAHFANAGNQVLWRELLRRLSQAFPHLRVSTIPEFDEIFDACAEMYSRHPDEMSHLSSKVVDELVAAAERKKLRAALGQAG